MKLCIYFIMIVSASLLNVNAEPFSWKSADSHVEATLVSSNDVTQVTSEFLNMEKDWTIQAPQVLSSGLPLNVPEPATLFLLGSGLIGIASTVRRKHKTVRSKY